MDSFETPKLGCFLEVKSSTWSQQDAKKKASLAEDLLKILGGTQKEVILKDYIEMAEAA